MYHAPQELEALQVSMPFGSHSAFGAQFLPASWQQSDEDYVLGATGANLYFDQGHQWPAPRLTQPKYNYDPWPDEIDPRKARPAYSVQDTHQGWRIFSGSQEGMDEE